MINRGATSVYIIASACGHVKVGVAVNVEKRLKQLQGSNPHALSVASVYTSAKRIIAEQIECRAHALLGEFRIRGEWFNCSQAEAVAAVEKAAAYVRHRRGGLAWSSDKYSRNLGASA